MCRDYNTWSSLNFYRCCSVRIAKVLITNRFYGKSTGLVAGITCTDVGPLGVSTLQLVYTMFNSCSDDNVIVMSCLGDPVC